MSFLCFQLCYAYILTDSSLVLCCILTSFHEFNSLKHTHRRVHSFYYLGIWAEYHSVLCLGLPRPKSRDWLAWVLTLQANSWYCGNSVHLATALKCLFYCCLPAKGYIQLPETSLRAHPSSSEQQQEVSLMLQFWLTLQWPDRRNSLPLKELRVQLIYPEHVLFD